MDYSRFTTLKNYFRLLRYGFKANKFAMSTSILILTIVTIIPFVTSFFDSKILDEVVGLLNTPNEDRVLTTLISIIIVIISLSVVEKALWAFFAFFEKVMFFDSSDFFTRQFLSKSIRLDINHYEDQKTNSIIQKARDMYDWRTRDSINNLIWLIADVIGIISSVLIVLNFSFIAFLLIVIASIPNFIANLKLGKNSWGIWDADTTLKYRYWWTRDQISREDNLMENKIFGNSNFLLNYTTALYQEFMQKAKKDQVKRSLIESVLGNITALSIMGFWVTAIFSALAGSITVGLLTFYVSAMYRFSDSLSRFFKKVSSLYEESLYINDYFKFIDLKENIISGNRPLKVGVPPTIEFKNVSFKYPETDTYVIKNMSFRINPYEKIAFVGINGAGKTTIVKLITRFYDVTEGEILVNGVNIQEYNLDDLYSNFGVLLQRFSRYGQFNVKENIEIGDVLAKSSKAKLDDAIFKADAENFINDYKDGLDQILDKSFENGIDPSGGQWQKIALARIFYRNSNILILDEPTSAIDAKAEFDIFERLYEFTENKSVIIISHRFSTVRKADRIIVIDKGSVIEEGTHADLLELNGKYADAFLTQAKGYA